MARGDQRDRDRAKKQARLQQDAKRQAKVSAVKNKVISSDCTKILYIHAYIYWKISPGPNCLLIF
jgi:hypothetical protein